LSSSHAKMGPLLSARLAVVVAAAGRWWSTRPLRRRARPGSSSVCSHLERDQCSLPERQDLRRFLLKSGSTEWVRRQCGCRDRRCELCRDDLRFRAGPHHAYSDTNSYCYRDGYSYRYGNGYCDRYSYTNTVHDCHVDASTGNDANGGASPGDAKLTIQAAVTQVSVSGTVIVAAVPNEDVTIPRPSASSAPA
jgi:hypothetical protein